MMGITHHHGYIVAGRRAELRQYARSHSADTDGSGVQWIPVVTFLQVSADMAVAIDVPDGHGHRYVDDVANGWTAVLQPPG
jgi:uncharacterized membrane protein